MQRLGVVSLGLVRRGWLRRMLRHAGWRMQPGVIGVDAVGVWGRSRAARRGALLADRLACPLITIEDAFLRSVRPGPAGEPPYGLILDDLGIYFDAARPSRLEVILQQDDLSGADEALALWQRRRLSKYNHWVDGASPDGGYVLVIDQSPNDASIRFGGATVESFGRMLQAALDENPGRNVLIRGHPAAGAGHFGSLHHGGRIGAAPPDLSPAQLLKGAARVYTVTSQIGFEAILAGHRPRIFGQPFYAGWGLGEEEQPMPRRTRRLTASELFAGAMLRYPIWFDPFHDRRCEFTAVAGYAAEEARAWAANARPADCFGVRSWKRASVARFLSGPSGKPRFSAPAGNPSRRQVVWASRESPAWPGRGCKPIRMEDGFIRSRGLGARLVAPASLVLDDLGIYYDPSRPSRLETLIAAASELPPARLRRAERLRRTLIAGGVSKYNLSGAALPELPGHRQVLLVAGQVEDDASVRLGATGAVRTNLDLLQAARDGNPECFLVYKPHPDVQAGLRPGAVSASGPADILLGDVSVPELLEKIDGVWTLTSLLGFEALLRGIPVTCLGAPFYAGWGLTRDLAPVPERRMARPTLDALVQAALIDYPHYVDPVTGRTCPVEVIVARLASGDPRMGQSPSPLIRLLARLQDRFAGRADLWR